MATQLSPIPNNWKNRGGFTLIELLVVIAIIAILVTIAVPTFLGQRTKAIRSEAMTNLESIRLLQEQRYAEEGSYAPDAGDCTSPSDTNIDDIRGVLPGFKPGAPEDLYFFYCIEQNVDFSGVSNTPCFRARAFGKGGSPVEDHELAVDCNNVKDF